MKNKLKDMQAKEGAFQAEMEHLDALKRQEELERRRRDHAEKQRQDAIHRAHVENREW